MNNIQRYFDLYKINKVGLINENKRMCACGQELTEADKTCPSCGVAIKKTALLNVAKNNALGKRYETIKDLHMVYFKYYHLLSSGFELNETEMLTIAINTMNAEVKVSDLKIFKSLDQANNVGLEEFFNTEFPGFKEFVYKCLGEFRYDMAISNFGSLDDGKLTNFMNMYLNYKALIPYIRGYKILYQGRKVNLKKYYPDVDFNNEEQVKATKLNLDLLLSWDLKNEKYVEAIIEISNIYSAEVQRTLADILHSMLSDRRSSETYNNTIESFSLLYNKEISVEDFIRIYNNSRDNYFNQIFLFRKLYKKHISKTIDWSAIDKIDRRTIGVLSTREDLKSDMKISVKQMDEIFGLVESNPQKALNYFIENEIINKDRY
jgi:hypothetical protein